MMELSLSTAQPWRSPQYWNTSVSWIPYRDFYQWKLLPQHDIWKWSASETQSAVRTSFQRYLLVVRQNTDGLNNVLSIATYIWQFGMMEIISKQTIEVCTQVEATQWDISAASPIVLKSGCMRIPSEPIVMCGHSWPQCQLIGLQLENGRARWQGETVIGERYATWWVVLMPDIE